MRLGESLAQTGDARERALPSLEFRIDRVAHRGRIEGHQEPTARAAPDELQQCPHVRGVGAREEHRIRRGAAHGERQRLGAGAVRRVEIGVVVAIRPLDEHGARDADRGVEPERVIAPA